MGIFSQDKTTTNQTSYNQQLGLNTQSVSGAQLTSGGGSVSSFGNAGLSVGGGGSSAIYTSGGASIGGGGSSGNTITVNNSLDASALQGAETLIGQALTANTATTQAALTGFQNATSVASEQPQAQGVSAGTANVAPLSNPAGGTPLLGGIINTHDLLLVAAAIAVGAVLFIGYRKMRH